MSDNESTKSAADKRQFNIYLPRDFIIRVKIAAIAEEKSLSRFVQDALSEKLERLEGEK